MCLLVCDFRCSKEQLELDNGLKAGRCVIELISDGVYVSDANKAAGSQNTRSGDGGDPGLERKSRC